MKAVILCDDSTFAAQARSILQRVGHRPEVTVRWTIKTWPVVAFETAMSEEALRESADAHLIVIPREYARSLPLHLRDWLERWAALRLIEHAAVGVIGDGLTYEVSLELKRLVQRHGLNLITDRVSVVQGAAKLSVNFALQHEQPLPITLAHLSYMTMDDRCRAFGIND